MKNYTVNIFNKRTRELYTCYTIEEETKTIARLQAIGRFRRDFSELEKEEVVGIATESKRNIVSVQSPTKWQFI